MPKVITINLYTVNRYSFQPDQSCRLIQNVLIQATSLNQREDVLVMEVLQFDNQEFPFLLVRSNSNRPAS